MFFPFRFPGIGVIELSGVIGTNIRTQSYGPLLDALRKSPRVRAVVVDIDSPGGTGAASEFLYLSVERIAREKPVVAFIRGTGASGAYMVGCAASKIVALPMAFVGSIGVIWLRPMIQDLLGKLGVGLSIYKGGRLKDMYGYWRPPTPEEEAKMQGLIQEAYDRFVEIVAKGRKLEEAKVREYATGELFSAKKAQGMGLVDELGDFERALELASELGRVPKRLIWIRPRRTLAERLAGRFAQAMVETAAGELERSLMGGVMYMSL